MPTVRIYVRLDAFKNWPGVQSWPLAEFDPIPDDNAGQPFTFGVIEVTPGKCFPFDIEIPEGFALVELFPGCKHVEAPDGTRMSAGDIVDAFIKAKPGFRLIDSGKA